MAIAPVSFSGLASGIDSQALIKALVQAESVPITQLQQKSSDAKSQSTRFGKIRTQVDALRLAATALNSSQAMHSAVATSSNSDVVSIAGASGAARGSWSVRVDALAKQHMSLSTGFTDRATAGLIAPGTLEIHQGTDVFSITVGATDTLDTIAAQIAATGAPLNVSAMNDGSAWHLMITSNATGAANDLTYVDSSGLGFGGVGSLVQAASDARFAVNGVAVTRPSNSVSDAIPSVTFDLQSESATSVVVKVAEDSNALTGKLTAFVDAYNSIQKSINSEATYTGAARVGDSLSGDSTLRSLQGRMRDELQRTVSVGTATYSTLAQIGLSVDRSGVLSLDQSKLTAALAASPNEVAQLIAGSDDGSVQGVMDSFINAAEGFATGPSSSLGVRLDALSNRVRAYSDQIDRIQLRIDKFEETLVARFAALEKIISSLQSQGSALLSNTGLTTTNNKT